MTMLTSLDQREVTRTSVPVMRQARLRPTAAHLYPTLLAGRWLSAATVAGQLLDLAGRTGAKASRQRVLPAEHFEFQGGYREATTRHRARTRWTDHFSSPMR